MEDWTPKKLTEALIEKHDRLIQEYSDSMEGLERLAVLKEKKDQLEYWVDSDGAENFLKELSSTKKELEKLEKNLIATDLRPNELRKRVSDHVQSKKYWVKKLKEYEDG